MMGTEVNSWTHEAVFPTGQRDCVCSLQVCVCVCVCNRERKQMTSLSLSSSPSHSLVPSSCWFILTRLENAYCFSNNGTGEPQCFIRSCGVCVKTHVCMTLRSHHQSRLWRTHFRICTTTTSQYNNSNNIICRPLLESYTNNSLSLCVCVCVCVSLQG